MQVKLKLKLQFYFFLFISNFLRKQAVEESEVKAYSTPRSGAGDTATAVPRTHSLGLGDNWKQSRCGNQVDGDDWHVR